MLKLGLVLGPGLALGSGLELKVVWGYGLVSGLVSAWIHVGICIELISE